MAASNFYPLSFLPTTRLIGPSRTQEGLPRRQGSFVVHSLSDCFAGLTMVDNRMVHTYPIHLSNRSTSSGDGGRPPKNLLLGRYRRNICFVGPPTHPSVDQLACTELQLDGSRLKFKDIKELVAHYSDVSQSDLPACIGPNSQAE